MGTQPGNFPQGSCRTAIKTRGLFCSAASPQNVDLCRRHTHVHNAIGECPSTPFPSRQSEFSAALRKSEDPTPRVAHTGATCPFEPSPRGRRAPLGTTHASGAVPPRPLLVGPSPTPSPEFGSPGKNLPRQHHRDRVHDDIRKTMGKGQPRCRHGQLIYCMTAMYRAHHDDASDQNGRCSFR